jgi:hypothetical protein
VERRDGGVLTDGQTAFGRPRLAREVLAALIEDVAHAVDRYDDPATWLEIAHDAIVPRSAWRSGW